VVVKVASIVTMDGKRMSDTEQLLRIIADQLGGVLKHYECSDRTTKHKKYVIEYAKEEKSS
jgi:hypothetical protein